MPTSGQKKQGRCVICMPHISPHCFYITKCVISYCQIMANSPTLSVDTADK